MDTRKLVALGAALAMAACGACGGASGAGDAGGGAGSGGGAGGGTSGTSGGDPIDASPLASTGTIAYVRGDELRAVEPDGSNDHLVWKAPAVPGGGGLAYHVHGPAWRPDGSEIAFSSDHEEAFSPYSSDIYAVRPDGKALRKLTNGPTRARHASFPKGSVTVRVQNATLDAGPFIVIVLGGEPQSALIPTGTTKAFTFTDVADLGDGLQPVVAAFGGQRWFGGAAADVKAGQTVDAGVLTLSGATPLAAVGPFWRGDGSRVGFFDSPCILDNVPALPAPGADFRPLVSTEAFKQTCSAVWGPTAATAGDLLLVDSSRGDGALDVLRVKEGATSKPAPVTAVTGFATPDLQWLPDASGFYVVTQADIVAPFQVYQFTFADGRLAQLSSADLAGDAIRHFSVSPDGQQVVFERTDDVFELTSTRTDLWIMNRDGSGVRLLAAGGREPAWNPTRR